MRVKMLEDAPGSPDGVQVFEYESGKVYEVTDDLGRVFIAEGFASEDKSTSDKALADPVVPEGADTDGLTKASDGPAENKGA